MKQIPKVGELWLVKQYGLFGGIFHARIKMVKKGIFWDKYLAEWQVNDHDYGIKYNKIGFVRSWNLICKD